MWSKEKVNLVTERLEFIHELTKVREHFRGLDKIQFVETQIVSHPYKHFSALRIYLALTCFDILGQPDDWRDFGSWLKSKSKTVERNEIFDRHKEKDLSDSIISIHSEYTNLYGVKKSFTRFIREVLSNDDREKLFSSIEGQRTLTHERLNQDGTKTLSTGERIELDVVKKEEFLFEIRNSFTHKGISIGHSTPGFFSKDIIEVPLVLPDSEPIWLFHGLYNKKLGSDEVTFCVSRWPFVIIEIIENSLKRYSTGDPS